MTGEATAQLMAEAEPSELELELDVDVDVELWPEHVDVVNLFVALDTQWRLVGLGGMAGGLAYAGLDYVAAREVAAWMGVAASPRLLKQLRVLEAEALPLRNARG